MSENQTFRVVKSVVPDPDVWPTDYSKTVERYSLEDQRGVVWVNGHPFGFLHNMTSADTSSSDCRCLLRKTPELANRDKFPVSVDANDPDVGWACYVSDWDRRRDLIPVFGLDAVIDGYFEASGSSVVRDYGWPEWINRAIDLFGVRLKDRAQIWLTRTPRFMPTSYLYEDAVSRARKEEWERNIVDTAQAILARLEQERAQ